MHSIYYQGVISVEKGTVIIRYKLPELSKNSFLGCEPRFPAVMFQAWLRRGVEPCCLNAALPQPCFKHDRRVYLSDILPGSCSVEKGSMIIRYKLPELSQKLPRRRIPLVFQAWLGRWVEPCSPAAMFQAWEASVLIRYTIRELSMLKMERYCIILSIISAGDALMLVTHLYQKARCVTHRFEVLLYTSG